MFHRLTALVLALIVASPACWCSWSHAGEKAHVRSCCEAKAQHKRGTENKDKNCPCSQALKSREVVQAKVKVPEPVLAELQMPALSVAEITVVPAMKTFADHDPLIHGPPREVRPLYHLDCSLLI